MGNINELLGKTIAEITGLEPGSDTVVFKTSDDKTYFMYHSQDCCEHVSVEDVVGDVSDLIGNPILLAEEETNNDNPKGYTYSSGEFSPDESHTWTFYKLSTIKGSVTIRWYGSSNGYYSERVEFHEQGKNIWD